MKKAACWLPILLLALACATDSHFLASTSPDLNKWLNTVVDVDLIKVPVGELSQRAPFRDVKFVCSGLDETTLITFQETRITRRLALYQLADRNGLSMQIVPVVGNPPYIVITNRETLGAIKPLP